MFCGYCTIATIFSLLIWPIVQAVSNEIDQISKLNKDESHTDAKQRHSSKHLSSLRGQRKRQWNECHLAYEERISQHCSYPGMLEPCYTQNVLNMTDSEKTTFSHAIESIVKECCQVPCSVDYFERLCCRTPDCIKQCYGIEIGSGDQKMNSFRYFDVLTRVLSNTTKKHRHRKTK
ncbi:hypothetical protein DdX_02792 [Ditylenchus destructor]|uniref:Uncharacterized protein n=1 Tax=Ditylenchus destructor TaxID=166010 RepID=A0AAD4NI81_9BILA|nr:hypothetical protein DdX_02792 [Ditylenchus destructor]